MNIIYQFVIDLEEKYRDMIVSFSNDSIHDYRVLVRKNQQLFGFLKEEFDNNNYVQYFKFHKEVFEVLSGVRDLKVGMELLSERYGVVIEKDLEEEISRKVNVEVSRLKENKPSIDVLTDLENLNVSEFDLINYLFVRLCILNDRLKRQDGISEKSLSNYHEERKLIKKIRYIIGHINKITNIEIINPKGYKEFQDVYGLLNDLDNIKSNFIDIEYIPFEIIENDISKLTNQINELKVVSKVKRDIKKIKNKKNNFYKNYNHNASKVSIVTGKAVILDDMNRILFVKRSKKYKGIDGLWELPGGRIDYGEEINVGVKREVFEETGLRIKSLEVGMLWELFRENKPDILGVTFICRTLSIDILLSEEHHDYKWVEIKELQDFNIIKELKEDFYEKGLLRQLMRYII